MSVTEIEAAITELTSKDLDELISWLAEHHAKIWDRQIEEDLEAGRLDSVLAEVDKEYEAGRAEPL
jgi:phage terminase Nu1 subunit (DNA packaging protein)